MCIRDKERVEKGAGEKEDKEGILEKESLEKEAGGQEGKEVISRPEEE